MILNYKNILPKRFCEASYEDDVNPAIKAIATEQIQKRDGLYLWGDPGGGKTHVACAIAKNLIENGFDVKFHNTGDLLERIRQEFNQEKSMDVETGLFKEVLDFKGILILDDIGAEKSSEWVRERIYLILNKRYEEMLPTIFTSNCDLENLSVQMSDRISSRIAGMTVRVHISGVDRRKASPITQTPYETN